MRLAKTRLAVVAGLFALAGCASTAAPPAAMSAAPAATGPALWKVADADTTIYLFGTVHALPKDTAWRRPAIDNALAASDTLVTEIDLKATDPAAAAKLIGETAMLPAGQTLRGLLSADQRIKFEASLADLGLPVAAFDRFEPWYASIALTAVRLSKAGFAGENGVEKTLDSGLGADKKRDALETAAFQLGVFDGLPQDAQIDFLMQVADSKEDVGKLLAQMVAEWIEGDADGLAALMNKDMQANRVLYERLLFARNRNWAGWIENRLKTPGTVFVAVGAGHLAGADSVQDALKARGIATARLP